MRIDDINLPSWSASGPTLNPNDVSPSGQGFAAAMDLAQQAQWGAQDNGAQTRTLLVNENLTQVVRQQAKLKGLQLDATQQNQAIAALAKGNQIKDPDRVQAGQLLNLDPLNQQLSRFQVSTSVTTQPTATGTDQLSLGPDASSGTSKPLPLATQEAWRRVKRQDTLSQIVNEAAIAKGVKLSATQLYKEVMDLAQVNRLSNPNQIWPGQQLNLTQLQDHLQQTSTVSSPGVASATASTIQTPVEPHAVLRQTLDRAVARGFIPANERQDVYNKILQVAQKHHFSPDDFARLTLMESDGMNPRATNQRCHGIIQFCEGSAKGAAGVGYGQSPKAILNLSVYQQLHLVDTYFDQLGLKQSGPLKLDDLYLAVLQPAARAETRPNAALGIAGTQAQALYESRDPQSSITRNSIIQGLLKNAMDRLGLGSKPSKDQVGSNLPLNPSAQSSDPVAQINSERL